MRTLTRAISIGLAFMLSAPVTYSNEGMWLFTDPPRKSLKEQFGFEPTAEWLEHVQKASVRFNSGGSGSFVSPEGLVLSNHHVGADALQKLSTEERDLLRDGYHARTRAEELRCHDLELNVLMSIEDVTERVKAAVKTDLSAEDAFAARRAVMAEIEKESLDNTGLRSDVVTLYQGGKYHLYRYKRYTDVRLVFAPEKQAAFFGGDPDNFEYPRYCYDICFFRAYENDQPAKVEHYLKWSESGPSENELVFVSGHPGGTSRSLTMDELEYKRDVQFPQLLEILHRLEVMLSVYGSEGAENARRANDMLMGVQNSRKAREGGYAGLLDPGLMNQKRQQEEALKDALRKADKTEALAAFDKIAAAQKVIQDNALAYNLLEGGRGFGSDYFGIARTLVRAAHERSKPSGERLREFRDSNRESLELALFSGEPLYDEFEQVKLENGLTYLVSKAGFSNPLVQKILAGKSPRERAAELVLGTDVDQVETRRRLYSADPEALRNTQDAMIQLALLVDEPARELRKIVEAQDEIKRQAYGQIAAARFDLMGSTTYPDATFTLRLAFGEAKGYEEAGKRIPFQTTLAGLYDRAAAQKYVPPFELPKRWVEKRDALDLDVPYNFVCTADIIGGNSGSPVLNRKGEFVGIIFDGNIYSLVLDFIYTDEKARAVSVHSRGILEALRKVYDARELVNEVLGARSRLPVDQ